MMLAGNPTIHRFMLLEDGKRNIEVTWTSGASVMVGHQNPDPEAVVQELQRLTQERKRNRVLSDAGCIRVDESGSPWLLNKRENGWGSFGFQYSTWGELLDEWDIGVGAPQVDEHGTWWPIIPRQS